MDNLTLKTDSPKAGYTLWVLRIVFAWALPFCYIATHGLPLPFFFSGLFLLGFWKYYKRHWTVFTPLVFLLLMAFFRSDFITDLIHNKPIGQAFADSQKVFLTPQLIFMTLGATLLAVDQLDDARTSRLMSVVKYALLLLGTLLTLEAISMGQLQQFLRTQVWQQTLPKMVVVRLSNINTAMLLMFWPLAYYLNHHARRNLVVLLFVVILWLGFIVGTNLQIIALLIALGVFMLAKSWPLLWREKGFGFERVLAGGAAGLTLGFPVLILALKSLPQWDQIVTGLPQSWAARLNIWAYTTERCLEKPWWGWGYESARQFSSEIPAHPHNMSLQAWLEFGIPGLVALAAFWGLLFLRLKPDPLASANEIKDLYAQPTQSDIYPYLLATASLYFIINTLSYGLWRSWLFAAGAMAAMLCIIVYKAVRFDMAKL